MDLVKQNLYFKVQDIIKNVKIKKYAKEGENISSDGISFLGAFNGKNTLQLEKMKNIKLRIELLQSKRIEVDEECKPEDMMADIYACAITELCGNFTPEMKEMYDKIKDEYLDKSVSDENIYKLVCKKIENSQSYLPIIHQEKNKGIFANTKVQTEFYKLENKRLEDEIVLERGKSQIPTFSNGKNMLNKIIPINVKNVK